jgi:hypothetical protein
METMSPMVVKKGKEKSIEGCNAKFTWDKEWKRA